jgi:hypothetical protein
MYNISNPEAMTRDSLTWSLVPPMRHGEPAEPIAKPAYEGVYDMRHFFPAKYDAPDHTSALAGGV